MQVHQLFSLKHAARATQSLKAQNWSQLEFLALLESIGSHGPFASLAPPAHRALSLRVPSLTNPLIRHLCSEKLQSPGDEFKALLAASYAGSGDIELACALNSFDAPTRSKLIEAGARNLQPSTDADWARLFESCVLEDDFERARKLWTLRPPRAGVGEPSLVRFVELIGRHRDQGLLKSVLDGTKYEMRLSSGTVAACLNCFGHRWEDLLRLVKSDETLLAQTLSLTDARFICESLAEKLVDVLQAETSFGTMVGNLVLYGAYRLYTSQTVFHAHRWMVAARGFTPDAQTAQILANAAYRLGNSKLVSYGIWREMSHLPLSRGLYETMLACQLVGSDVVSAKFFLAEMTRRGVPIRRHIMRRIAGKFEKLGNTSALLDIAEPGLETRHEVFDLEAAAAESPNPGQALANLKLYEEGKSPHRDSLAVLAEMIAFDRKREKILEARRR